jgi:muramoyltetrapeptide carboxypeptidase
MSITHVIGIVAPSSPVPDGLVDQSITYFENLGFKVKTGKHLNKNELFAAGTDEDRAADIMDFVKDPEVSVIITTSGLFFVAQKDLPPSTVMHAPVI